MLKLAMSELLYPKLIYDYPNFYKFMQVYKTEENQAVIMEKGDQHVLYLVHTRDTKTRNTKKTKNFHTQLSHSKHKRCET